MSDLGMFLQAVTRIRIFSSAGLAISIAVGVMSINGVFGSMPGIILGGISVLLLLASIGGLIYAWKLIADLKKSFREEAAESARAMENEEK